VSRRHRLLSARRYRVATLRPWLPAGPTQGPLHGELSSPPAYPVASLHVAIGAMQAAGAQETATSRPPVHVRCCPQTDRVAPNSLRPSDTTSAGVHRPRRGGWESPPGGGSRAAYVGFDPAAQAPPSGLSPQVHWPPLGPLPQMMQAPPEGSGPGPSHVPNTPSTPAPPGDSYWLGKRTPKSIPTDIHAPFCAPWAHAPGLDCTRLSRFS